MCALLAEESGARKRSVRWMKRGLVMSRRLLPLVLISLVLSACGGGGGGVVSSTGTVTGLVFNFDANNTPVAGASVRISSGTSSTISGADGRYTLSNVPAGVQTLVASASGFPAVQRQVSVPAQGSATLNFGLTALGNPGLAGPSSYQGGTLTVNITSQGQSAIFAAAIAPQDVDGGTYSLQAVALSYFRTWPTSGAPRVTGIISSQKADPLSPRLRQLERERASRLPRKFSAPLLTVQRQVGSQATFWVITNASTLQQAQTTATLQAESAHGLLYVDNQDLGTIT